MNLSVVFIDLVCKQTAQVNNRGIRKMDKKEKKGKQGK